MLKADIIKKIETYQGKNGLPYKFIRITGGTNVLLAEAPEKQLYAMMKSLEKRKAKVEQGQLQFNFA